MVDSHTDPEPAVQWVVYNIPPDWTELGPNATENLPDDNIGQAAATSGKVGYQPPCTNGTYRFSVYALSGKVEVQESASLPQILKMIADQTIARGRLSVVNIE